MGCGVQNADTLRPAWAHERGSRLLLHPQMPPLTVVDLEPGRHLVAHGPADARARAQGRPFSAASWLFLVEPLPGERSRFISRFRTTYSDDLATRLTLGPTLTEPIGFMMDRRMLRGVKARAESLRSAAAPPRQPRDGLRRPAG